MHVLEERSPEYNPLELCARNGFYKLPMSFMRSIIQHMDWEGGNDLPQCETIVFICRHAIRKCRKADEQHALRRRSIHLDPGSDDMERLCEMEHVIDMFNQAEQQQLHTEITTAKQVREQTQSYMKSYRAYQALMARSAV